MMEPTYDNPASDNSDNHFELPPRTIVEDNAATMATTTMESSMDIEQPLPTVAELREKSDAEDNVRRRKTALCMIYALPFLVVAIVVIIAVAVTTGQSNSQTDLRKMDHDAAFAAVVEYLGNHNVSGYPELIRQGSYQNLAATWMAHGDAHSMSIPKGSPASKEGYAFVQRYVLVLLYYQMGGPQWKYNFNFLHEQNTCDWASWIVRKTDTVPMGAICNSNQLISTLAMIGANVKGRFPYELSHLSTLRVIEMDVNEISGSIPQSFHALTNLENLHLSHNKITGTLPAFVGNLPGVTSIDVSFNLMEGSLPASLGSMPKLRGIAVDHNLFTGNPGFWGQEPQSNQQVQLEYLFLEGNSFDGYLQGPMLDGLPNLKILDISSNQFQGAIPDNLFQLSKLQVLDLHDNNFTGSVPGGITSNTELKFLALHKNALAGKVGEEIGNLQFLVHLDLSNNMLTGYVVNEQSGFGLPSLKQLSYLFLSANKFPAGPVPTWVRELTQLEELSMKSLNLDGTIPTWLGELTTLKLLDLDNNNLNGSIPTEFGSLSSLQFLLLNRNQLTGMVPSELGNLEALRLLYLDNTEVRGDLDMFCKRAESSRPLAVADCGGGSPEVACDCCQICCVDDDGENCNDDNIVPSNDPMWQFGYDRVYYAFGNYTGFFVATP